MTTPKNQAPDQVKSASFMKPVTPSEQLAKVIGSEPLPRTEITKRLWDYIKLHKLQNPNAKRNIIADDNLRPIFGKDEVTMFEMTRLVNAHLT